MDSFLEVRGEAAVTESVVEYRADLTVSVRAAHVEVAAGEVEELRSQCIRDAHAEARSSAGIPCRGADRRGRRRTPERRDGGPGGRGGARPRRPL